MIRRLFTPASAISLLLACAMAALWVRSYFRHDLLLVAWGPHATHPGGYDPATGNTWSGYGLSPSCSANSNRGALSMGTFWCDWLPPNRKFEVVWKAWPDNADGGPWFEFRPTRWRWFPSVPWFSVRFPHAVLLAVFSALPLAWFARLRRRRAKYRLSHFECCLCGYDLRANKGRCPECGTPIRVEAKT